MYYVWQQPLMSTKTFLIPTTLSSAKMPRRPRPAKRQVPGKVKSPSAHVKDLPKPKFASKKTRFTKPDSHFEGGAGSDSSSDEFEEGSSQGPITRHMLEEEGDGEDDVDADASRVVQWAGDDEFYDGSEDENAGLEIPVEVRR